MSQETEQTTKVEAIKQAILQKIGMGLQNSEISEQIAQEFRTEITAAITGGNTTFFFTVGRMLIRFVPTQQSPKA